jgi:hypothetical protein
LFLASALTLAAQDDQREAVMGAHLARTFQGKVRVIHCPVAEQFIGEVGEKLSLQLPGERPSFQFTLIADDNGDPSHEPYALPGGYIFVPAKLILEAQNETDVAAMLAHSMARRFAPMKGGSIPTIWVPSFDRSLNLRIPKGLQAQREELDRQADHDSALAFTAAGYSVERNQPLSTDFLRVRRELRRVVPEYPTPSLLR